MGKKWKQRILSCCSRAFLVSAAKHSVSFASGQLCVGVTYSKIHLFKKTQCIKKHVSNSREFKKDRRGKTYPLTMRVLWFLPSTTGCNEKNIKTWDMDAKRNKYTLFYELKRWATVDMQYALTQPFFLKLKAWKDDHIIVSIKLNYISTHQLICQPFQHPWMSSGRSHRPGSRPSSWPSW